MLGFDRLVRSLFSNVFIAINIDDSSCHIRILRTKKDRVIEEIERDFDIVDGLLPVVAVRFIERYKKHYPFCYVGVIAKTYNQNVFQVRKIKEINKLGVDIKEYKALKLGDWGVCIKKNEIDEIQNFFKKVRGVDYIFSPFALMYQGISAKLDSVLRLYVLQEKSNIALFIANSSNVYFGGYFMVESDMDKEKNSTSFSPIVMKKEEVDPLDEFEDLDFDFIQDMDTEIRFDAREENFQEVSQAVNELTKAAVIAGIIQNALAEFYSNDYYEERFVEEIVFLDNVNMMEEALKHIEQVMLLPVSRWQINLYEELLEMIRREFKGK